MATDGVKIINGDTAYDTYWGIMDLYDSGATFETIRNIIPFPQADFYDDFDYEIYTTSYALAMWEIGSITDDIIGEVRKVIDKGACVSIWTEEHSIQLGKQRQKELDKLWLKIKEPNQKIRKRKKYKKIEKFLFDINDLLVFQLTDKNYYTTVLLNITQYRGECTYKFGKILYKGETIPTIETIKESEIIGRRIPSGFGLDLTSISKMSFDEIQSQGGLEEILKTQAKRTDSFVIGMNMIGIDHKDLINITNRFIKIGNLNLREVCKKQGSLGGAATFDDLTRNFYDLREYIKIFGEDTLSIKELLDE